MLLNPKNHPHLLLLFLFTLTYSLNTADYEQARNIICPIGKVLCPDNDCATSLSSCSTYVPKCPPHKPYKCWNNECRTSFANCPTQISCPEQAPFLCYTGFCVQSQADCKARSDEGKCKTSGYRCYDGTCVKSMELCATLPYCGKDAVKCWDGSCADSVDLCPNPLNITSCSNYLCPDGSCRASKDSCSTISICPPHIPVKCFDNSCRGSAEDCPTYQTCGNKFSCPDGFCALTREKCSTPITCFGDKPFLCYDGSCKKEISECPEPPKCTHNEVLCPNGACAGYRQNCKITDPCPSGNPIHCEKNTCTANYDECSSSTVTKRCPIGYVACPNGQCKSSEYLCDEFVCPENFPFKCAEGVCVENITFCDNTENGCPYNAPLRCANGTCVTDLKTCANFTCEGEKKACPDGSCIKEDEECPLSNGCYDDRPFKCADGTCINPETTTCSPVLCPYDAPYQCANGHCVKKQSDCTINLKPDDRTDCEEEGLIMCIDGRCVPSTDLCRPSFDCDTGYTKCPDGTCRVAASLCPKEVACPASRPYRCSNQLCVKSEDNCIIGFKCQEGYTRCEDSGSCVSDSSQCSSTISKKTGCPNHDQVRCPNGRCLSSESECNSQSDACPDDDEPYLCSNGECAASASSCKSGSCSKYLCPSGRCVSDDNKSKRTLCTNNIGCPLYKPYRCSNGDCVYTYKDCSSTSISSFGYLTSNVACDVSKPYLCADGSCVTDYTHCNSYVECDPQTKTKCDNGYCANTQEECQQFSNYCPLAAPIQCPSGSCVKDVAECAPAFYQESCSDGEFYCTRLAKCTKKKLDCLMFFDDYNKLENTTTRRLIEEDVINPLNDDSFLLDKNTEIKSFYSAEVTSEKTGTICYDGTIAAEGEKCPAVPGCKMGQYRCENGGCAYNLSDCINETDYTCPEGQEKCPDGLCHDTGCTDVNYHGCLVGQYQCSNGMCVKDKYECIGYSMCSDPAYPYRCITGACQSSPDECPTMDRLGEVKPVTYSFSKYNKISFAFAVDQSARTTARIEIPSNGFEQGDNEFSQVYVAEVGSSFLYKQTLYNDSAEFLYNVSNCVKGSEGVLTFQNSVLSPVFKFYTTDKTLKFKMNGLVTLIHNIYDVSGLNCTDYCLAKLNGYDLDKDEISYDKDSTGWACTDSGRKLTESQTGFKIKEFGVYAVILNPLRAKRNYLGDSEAKNFFLENVKIILIVFVIIVILLILISYIFSRVGRYREKYHENRSKILLMQQQRQEYENMTTDIFGQTLGDNINGIVYKANPCYSANKEIKHKDTTLEEEIENLQIQCKLVSEQNERAQQSIDDLTEKYKLLSSQMDRMAAGS